MISLILTQKMERKNREEKKRYWRHRYLPAALASEFHTPSPWFAMWLVKIKSSSKVHGPFLTSTSSRELDGVLSISNFLREREREREREN
jgi:hypothetical protein